MCRRQRLRKASGYLGHDRQLKANGVKHLHQRPDSGVPISGERLVKALAPELRLFGDRSHPLGPSNVAQGPDEELGVVFLQGCLEILDNGLAILSTNRKVHTVALADVYPQLADASSNRLAIDEISLGKPLNANGPYAGWSNRGARFSRNARTASRWSSCWALRDIRSASSARQVRKSACSARFRFSFM